MAENNLENRKNIPEFNPVFNNETGNKVNPETPKQEPKKESGTGLKLETVNIEEIEKDSVGSLDVIEDKNSLSHSEVSNILNNSESIKDPRKFLEAILNSAEENKENTAYKA